MFNEDELQQLYRYSYSLTCDEHTAYDLLQAALEKFIKSNAAVKQKTAYVKKIIYNQFIDECRREKIIQFEMFEETLSPVDINEKTLDELLVDENMANQILQSLEPHEREIMFCWAIEGFSTSEIAEKFKKPRGTILSCIYRMRKKIIDKFDGNSSDVMEREL